MTLTPNHVTTNLPSHSPRGLPDIEGRRTAHTRHGEDLHPVMARNLTRTPAR